MTLRVSKYGYVYVEVPDQSEVEKRKHPLVSHIEYYPDRLSGEIICILKTINPVHIGSGTYELAADAGIRNFNGVVKGILKEDDSPVIPGSSLKGVFRSISEAISYSCCNQACEAKTTDSKLCIACGIFGAMGFAGRVSFSKATIINKDDYKSEKENHKLPKSIAMWRPNKAQEGRRFYPHIDYLSDNFWNSSNKGEFVLTMNKAKQQFIREEVVEPYDFIPEGVELEFTTKFENLNRKEIGLVLSGMGVGLDNQPVFQPHIGGSKPFCFGAIEVRVKHVRISYQKGTNNFTNFVRESQPILEDPQEWVKKKVEAFLSVSPDEVENLLFRKGFDQVKETLHFSTQLPVIVY